MEPVLPMAFGGCVAKAGLDRFRDLPDIPRVNDAAQVASGGEVYITARGGLQMLVADVQLPALVFLKQSHGDDVVVVLGRHVPAIQRVTVSPQSRPAEVFAHQQFRLDRRRTKARSQDSPSRK